MLSAQGYESDHSKVIRPSWGYLNKTGTKACINMPVRENWNFSINNRHTAFPTRPAFSDLEEKQRLVSPSVVSGRVVATVMYSTPLTGSLSG